MRVLASMSVEQTASAAFGGPPSVAHAEALVRGIESGSAVLDEPLDTLCIGLPRTTLALPRERPNALANAATGLGYALRLWRDAFPVRDGGTVILVAPFRRRFAHPTQQPYRAFFQATRAGHPAATLVEAERTAAADTRAIKAYRDGRTCHPRLPFADWDACRPALDRLGAVLVAGCRDATAARQLGFVPTHGISAAFQMARGLGGDGHRVGFLLSPPYFPIRVGSTTPFYPRVCLPDALVRAQRLRVVRERDRAGLEHVAAAGDVERHQGVLLDEQDRGALLVDLDDDLEDPLDEDRREAHRRLVEEQERRVGHQGPADRAHLLLAAGHRPRLLRLALGQAGEEREHAVEVLLQAGLGLALEGAHLEVLEHRHPREELAALRGLRDAAGDDVVRRVVGDVLAAEADPAAAWMVEPVDRPQRRRLARTVRAEQRHDLPVPHLQGDALERMDRAVVGVDALELEDRRLGRGRRGCRGDLGFAHWATAAFPR